MLSCQATQVLDFLASRGIISWVWVDELSQLNTRKGALMESRQTDIMNDSVIEYISHHEDEMTYEECSSVLSQLIAGPDGEARYWRIFGGGYRSKAVQGWKELMDIYDTKHLELVEFGLKLKRILSEIKEAQRTLSECNENISAIGEKIAAAHETSEKLLDDLRAFHDDFTADTPVSDLEDFARSLSTQNSEKLVSCVVEILESESFQSLFSGSQISPPSSQGDFHAWALVVEEMYGMYKTRLFENSLDREAPGALAILKPLRSQLAAIACIDTQIDSDKNFQDLRSIQKRISKTHLRLEAFRDTEQAQLHSVRETTERLSVLRPLRTKLITTLESKLVPFFPNGVTIQLSAI